MTVFDMNPQTMENLVEAGAKGAEVGGGGGRHLEVSLTSLPGSPEVEALYLGDGGAIEAREAGQRARRSEQRAALDAAQARGRGEGARACSFWKRR